MHADKPLYRLAVCICLCVLGSALPAAALPGQDQAARFTITNEVVNPDVQAFTATIGGFGNSLFSTGSGFEPVIFRNRYIATENAPDRLVARPEDISHWDTYREGMLDGASVRVYRIEYGSFRLVRQDTVASGGFHASGWQSLLPKGSVVAPDQTTYRFRWAEWNRPGVHYHFAVRAVDSAGKLSPVSNVVAVTRPEKTGGGEPANTLKAVKGISGAAGDLPAPRGLKAVIEPDNSLRLDWDAAADERVAGYLVYRSDDPPETHRGYYLQLSKTPAEPDLHIRAGDVVIVDKKFYDASRRRYHTHRVWGAPSETQALMPGLVPFFPNEDPAKTWQLVRHADATPVADAGETFLRLQLAAGVKKDKQH